MTSRTASLMLLAVTAVWGWTFVVVQGAVRVYGVLPFLALRFVIAAAATCLVSGWSLRPSSARTGLGIGAVLAVGYLLQTWGLLHTSATSAGLITGLFVVVAPLADRVLYGTSLPRSAALAVLLSLVGMSLLTGRLPTSLAFGDLLILGCALAFGVHVALLSRHAPRHDPAALISAQMLACAVLFVALWPVSGPLYPPPREVWWPLIATGLVASALGYTAQTLAQRHLPAVRTAIILTCEPVFAGLFGYLLAGDRLGPLQLAGGSLILAALLLSELVPKLRRARG
jgi:drug/metabolite transporter (DMT)-like permease